MQHELCWPVVPELHSAEVNICVLVFPRSPHDLHRGPCAEELQEEEASQKKTWAQRKERKGENLGELL